MTSCLRIVTWNCRGGDALSAAAELDVLSPDVVVVQECAEPPAFDPRRCVWRRVLRWKGIAVVARGEYSVQLASDGLDESVEGLPVRIDGPVPFHLLAIWTTPKPSYVGSLARSLDAYASFLTAAPSVVAGDFNSHPKFDGKRVRPHARLVDRFRDEFGLVSAWHTFHRDIPESPTHYHLGKLDRPFHIDYCFVPQSWAAAICDVSVGSYEEWSSRSGNRPLMLRMEF